MYVIETLPLSINLETSPYIPNANIDLVEVQPVRTLMAMLNCSHDAAVPYSSWLSVMNSSLEAKGASVSVLAGMAGHASFQPMQAVWGALTNLDMYVGLPSESSGIDFAVVGGQSWEKATSIDYESGFGFQQAKSSLQDDWGLGFSTQLNNQTCYLIADTFFVDHFGVRPDEYQLQVAELYTSANDLIQFDESHYVPSADFSWGDYRLERQRAVPMTGLVAIAAYQPPSRETPAVLPWGTGRSRYYTPELPYVVEPINTDPVPAPAADKQEVYIIMNHVDVYSLPDNIPLSVSDISIELDEDSFSWKFACVVLNQASIDLMKPSAGVFKEIGVNINGHIWKFFISSWQQAKSINGNDLNKRFQVVGYSRTQYLAEQFAPKRTQSIGNTTAVQAATAELAGTGFVCDWRTSDLPDWTMPGSIFSYQEMAPLQVIKKLAETVGGIVIPSMNEDKIIVTARHRLAPWSLATEAVDRTVHENQILSSSGQMQPKQQINAVQVSGERVGVVLNVTRQGTAGDVSGADIVESWLSSIEANQSRGRYEIANSGTVETYTHELAIPESAAQPGLLIPGLYVEVQHQDATANYRARVTGLRISVPGRGLVKVRQSVSLERPVSWEAAA